MSEYLEGGTTHINNSRGRQVRVVRGQAEPAEPEDDPFANELADPPQLSDVARFELEKKDVDSLAKCKPGDCDVQIMDPERVRNATAKAHPC